MDLSPVSSSPGLSGTFNTHAERATRLSRPDTDPQLEKDLAELPGDAHNVSALAQVVKTQDRMLGELLDLLA